MAEIDVWLPRKLGVLKEPHRYKVLYGGRGGIKSWTVRKDVSAVYRTMPASLLTPFGTWDTSITLRSGWLSLSALSFGSSTSFRGAVFMPFLYASAYTPSQLNAVLGLLTFSAPVAAARRETRL